MTPDDIPGLRNQVHEQALQIARLEGTYEERTRNLEQADREMRKDFVRVEDKLDAMAERVSTRLDDLSTKVTRAGTAIAVGAAIGAAALSYMVRLIPA